MITGSRGVKIEPQQCLVLWWPCMVNSSKLGISKRKMVVGCSEFNRRTRSWNHNRECFLCGSGVLLQIRYYNHIFSGLNLSEAWAFSRGWCRSCTVSKLFTYRRKHEANVFHCHINNSNELVQSLHCCLGTSLCQSGKDRAWCYSVVWLPPCAEISHKFSKNSWSWS